MDFPSPQSLSLGERGVSILNCRKEGAGVPAPPFFHAKGEGDYCRRRCPLSLRERVRERGVDTQQPVSAGDASPAAVGSPPAEWSTLKW
jgi:hypothetical protein